jgi:hypothetical protein
MSIVPTNWAPDARQLRWFALLQIAFWGILAGTLRRQGLPSAASWTIFGVSAGLGLVGLVWPPVMRVVYLVWMGTLFPVSWIVSYLLLAAVFYLIVAPVGLILRLLGRDPCQRRFDPRAGTYWRERDPTRPVRDYFRQF